MFPILNLDELSNQINAELTKESAHEIGKVILLSFDSNNNATVVMENGKPNFATTITEKIQVYLQVLLRTEMDIYPVYNNTGFGMTYFNFRGNKIPHSIISSEIKRELTESLTKISLFDRIENFQAELLKTTLNISFDMILLDGTTLNINL